MHTIKTHLDLFSDEALLDPWPIHRSLRDTGPAVYLPDHDLWAVARYAEVRASLKDWTVATSRLGVSVGREFSHLFDDTNLTSDPPRHTELSKVFRERLSPGALREVARGIERRADDTIAELVQKREFDAITELSDRFPIEVVADLVGLPAERRENLRERAAAAFNLFGPNNARAQSSMMAVAEIDAFMRENATREHLTPGSVGTTLYEAADRGDLAQEDVLTLIQAYMIAGMDTTVNGLGSLIWLLAENPDQWQLLRERPELTRGAFDEALRLESPVMGFTRTVVTELELDGTTLPTGTRILPLLGSANRDERRWENADDFDITRDNTAHLAFGFGLHACTGRALAHLEARALLESMIRRIRSISINGPVSRRLNNQIRGLGSLPVLVVAESEAH